MKKSLFSFALAAFALCSSVSVADAQIKEGSVTYSVSIETDMQLPPEYAAMMQGIESTTYFKDKKSRTDVMSAMSNQIILNDGKGNTTVFIDAMGQKFYTKTSAKDQKNDKEPASKITYLNEKKTIAGYECKKAEIETTAPGDSVATKTTVWYTDKIMLPAGSEGKQKFMTGLKGFPMEFEMKSPMGKTKFSATKVSTAAVPDSKFDVSTEGYVEKTADELKMMGG